MDKHRVSTDPAELNDYINEFEAKNKQFAAEVDRVFMTKKHHDGQTQQLEEQINQLHHAAEQKIRELEPDKHQRYHQLLEHSHGLRSQLEGMQAELENVSAQVREGEGEGDAKSYKDEFAALQKRLGRLEKEERSLEEDMHIADLEPGQAQKQLLEKVKKMNAQTAELDGVAKDMKGSIAGQKKQLQELTNELAERKGESGEKDKYEKLHQRDEEMTQFIAEFESTRAAEVAEQQSTQDTVVALLEHISTSLAAEQDMPTQQRLREMKDEATFKEKQRLAEMEKIRNLDEKIQLELLSLSQKMEMMQGEMCEFEDIDGLSRRASQTVEYLNRLLKQYQSRKQSVQQQVMQLTSKYKGMKKELQSSETWKKLQAQEMKLRTYAQTIFALQEYVETKGRETDFVAMKENVMGLVEKLNKQAKDRSLGM